MNPETSELACTLISLYFIVQLVVVFYFAFKFEDANDDYL